MELRKITKKGQIDTISQSVIFLGIAAIALVLMMVILQELTDTEAVRSSQSANTTNETLTTVTETGEVLTLGAGAGGTASIEIITNNSDGVEIGSGNYTVSGLTVSFSGSSGDVHFNNTDWNVSYSATFGDEAFTSSNQTVVGLGTFGDFWTIIVLAVVAAVVIGIIFGLFGRPER